MDDWARTFSWRNDPETRQQSRDTAPVLLKEHMAWLKKTLAAQNLQLFVADDAEHSLSVGTARLDIVKRKEEEWAEISITIEPKARGRGYSVQLIAAVIEVAPGGVWKNSTGLISGLVANVKPANYASLRAFADCGFLPVKFGEELITLELAL